jgi:hypothetical protein
MMLRYLKTQQYSTLLFLLFFVQNIYGQSLQASIIGGYGADIDVLERDSRFGTHQFYSVHEYHDRSFHLTDPLTYGILIDYQFCKAPISIETGLTVTNRRIETYEGTTGFTNKDVGLIFNTFVIPLWLKFVLNPSAPKNDWKISAKLGVGLQEWHSNLFKDIGNSSVFEVDKGIYRQFLLINQREGYPTYMGGFDFEKTLPKGFGAIGFGFQYRHEPRSNAALYIWGYDPITKEQVGGYDPFYLRFSTLSVVARYTLPWQITWGKKEKQE